MVKDRVVLSWSGGKDGALALRELLDTGDVEIHALLTTVTEEYDRVSMHGIRRELLEAQAAAMGLPLIMVMIPKDCTNEVYAERMGAAMQELKGEGIGVVAFGDIHLEDVRKYREERLSSVGIDARFPLWGKDTKALARRFIDDGFKAVVTCVDTEQLDGSFSGREIDDNFLGFLPSKVDPCGENGEFHTFVYDGPMFIAPVRHRLGDRVLREDRFLFTDVVAED
jgi:uncharacterized protein (TIGR00290 family)